MTISRGEGPHTSSMYAGRSPGCAGIHPACAPRRARCHAGCATPPRRSCARLNSRLRRGINASGPRGRESRSPRSTSSQCATRPPAPRPRRPGRRLRRALAHVEAAERLPPFVGHHLHGLGQVERAIARDWWGCSSTRGSGTHRRWTCRNARHRTRTPPPCPSPASAGRRARGANAGGPKSRGVIAVAQDELHALECLVEALHDAGARQHVIAPLAMASDCGCCNTSGPRGATSTRSWKAHHLDRTGRRAHVAGMAGASTDEPCADRSRPSRCADKIAAVHFAPHRRLSPQPHQALCPSFP